MRDINFSGNDRGQKMLESKLAERNAEEVDGTLEVYGQKLQVKVRCVKTEIFENCLPVTSDAIFAYMTKGSIEYTFICKAEMESGELVPIYRGW